eukprot:2304610-Rhodomonas_salina.1
MLISLKAAMGWDGLPSASRGNGYREFIARALMAGKLVLNCTGERTEERRSTAQSSSAPSTTPSTNGALSEAGPSLQPAGMGAGQQARLTAGKRNR